MRLNRGHLLQSLRLRISTIMVQLLSFQFLFLKTPVIWEAFVSFCFCLLKKISWGLNFAQTNWKENHLWNKIFMVSCPSIKSKSFIEWSKKILGYSVNIFYFSLLGLWVSLFSWLNGFPEKWLDPVELVGFYFHQKQLKKSFKGLTDGENRICKGKMTNSSYFWCKL